MHMRRFKRAYERILKEGQRLRARRRPRWRQRKLSTNDPQETLRRPAIYRYDFTGGFNAHRNVAAAAFPRMVFIETLSVRAAA